MSKKVLFIVEGSKTEPAHIDKIAENFFLSKDDYKIAVYGTNIHVLYHALKSGDYSSTMSFLAAKEKVAITKGTKPDEAFSLIYLVFDFDPQDHLFSPSELRECLSIFSDETRNGQLYINYPMFESLRDVTSFDDESYFSETVPLAGLSSKSYKKLVNSRTVFKNARSGKRYEFIPKEQIPPIVRLNEIKHNRLCLLPEKSEWDQTKHETLLEAELKMLREDGEISVINSSVLFILDYNPRLLLNDLILAKH